MEMFILAQAQFNSGDPITPNGGISAGWVLLIAFTIIGALLVLLMNTISRNNTEAMKAIKEEIQSINKRQAAFDEKHVLMRKDHSELNFKVQMLEHSQRTQAQTIADEIITKLRAISPPL